MAEHPELWTDRSPERTLFDRTATFGLTRKATRQPPEAPPEPAPAPARRPRRERGPFLTYLCLPWSYSDDTTAERWHRMQCRLGRHRMGGGNTMQLDGTVIFLERQCRWCGAEDVAPG